MMGDVRNLKITSCRVGYNGSNNGKPYTLYNVEAEGVSAKLNSFSELPLGEGSFTVTALKREGEPTVYTLAPIDGAGSKTDALRVDLDALAAIVTDLAARIEAIEARFDGIGSASQADDGEDIPF
jgi:hypothetical protein